MIPLLAATVLFLAGCSSAKAVRTVTLDMIAEKKAEEVFDPQAYLLSLPEDPSGREDIVIINLYGGIANRELWDAFVKAPQGSVTLCMYTTEGDPIYTWLEFDGEIYTAYTDTTRDGYGTPEIYHAERRYLCQRTWHTVEETASRKAVKTYEHTDVFLTDDETYAQQKNEEEESLPLPEDGYHIWGNVCAID